MKRIHIPRDRVDGLPDDQLPFLFGLFRRGWDTKDIALRLNRTEAQVYNLLARRKRAINES
jgi:hypothetical protein